MTIIDVSLIVDKEEIFSSDATLGYLCEPIIDYDAKKKTLPESLFSSEDDLGFYVAYVEAIDDLLYFHDTKEDFELGMKSISKIFQKKSKELIEEDNGNSKLSMVDCIWKLDVTEFGTVGDDIAIEISSYKVPGKVVNGSLNF